MLDFFVIFGRGGIVLWCVEGSKDLIITSVNALVRSVILQERSSSGPTTTYDHGSLVLQLKLDNEFELVFVAGYQKILKLSYIDKFLTDVHREFRDRWIHQLKAGMFQVGNFGNQEDYGSFSSECLGLYGKCLKEAEMWSFNQAQAPRQMRTFEQSKKSSKTIASMIVTKGGKEIQAVAKESAAVPEADTTTAAAAEVNENDPPPPPPPNSEVPFKIIPKGVQRKPGPGKYAANPKSPKASITTGAGVAGKKPRQWEGQGNPKDLASLDRSSGSSGNPDEREIIVDRSNLGTMAGNIKPLEVQNTINPSVGSGSAMGNFFKGLVGGKVLTSQDLAPALEKLRDHLIAKNVAAEVAVKLCESVGAKLEGKSLSTFSTINSTVKSALESSLLTLLQPKHTVDVLREALEAKRQSRPFVITFCGVNGVGKSTNLAKIAFWLIENGLTVLVAACDTFRAGAVEQLRTHARHLNALHPRGDDMPYVQLYEKGYGKDAAGVAAEAIGFAKENRVDVVLVDTAGRMQDNEPLMRALAKLIRVNSPDLVLFVGEALVGNEAVDQLIKFNRALADFADSTTTTPRLLDGMVLTKFDTIDDKVGAAVSMVYITGQPILFVGTGQTYTDLRSLDPRAVVEALIK